MPSKKPPNVYTPPSNCYEELYVKYLSRRDFTFEKLSEDANSENPYAPFVVGRRDFIFPERICTSTSDVDFYYGETLYIDGLDVSASLELETDVYYGQTVEPFALIDVLGTAFFYGEEIEKFSLPIYFNTDIQYGQEIEKFSFLVLFDGDFYYGDTFEEGNIFSTFEPFDIYTGETAECDLFAYPVFWADIDYGQYIEDLIVRYSEQGVNFAPTNAYQGDYLEPYHLSNSHTALLYPYDIHGLNIFMSVNFHDGYNTFFEEYYVCCQHEYRPIPPLTHEWEIGKSYHPNEIWVANTGHQLLDTELTTMINMEAEFYSGENLVYYENFGSAINNISCYYGHDVRFKFDWERKHNLCPPRVIISGNNANFDVVDVKEYLCKSYQFLYGEEIEILNLASTYDFKGEFYHGEEIYIDVEWNEPWEFDLYYGENVYFDLSVTPFFEMDWYYGHIVEGKFYVPPIDIGYGDYVDRFNIIDKFYVEILDDECLENQYIYTDKDGVRRDDKSIIMAVEYLPYLHFIKARCF